MFADACEKAIGCSFPIVVSLRRVNGKIENSVCTAVMVNKDGWFITAGHIFEPSRKYNEDVAKMRKIDEDRKNGTVDRNAAYDSEWISQHSIWCGRDTARLSEVQVFPDVDMAVGWIIGAEDMIKKFPIFKDPAKVRIGESLCRMGYPVNDDDITEYDESKSAFVMKKGTQFAAFANEGMHTRNIYTGEDGNGIKKLFLEMSSPGLPGQSGGPILDRSGSIVAMHIGNVSLELKSSPITVNGRNVADEQYINIGIGVHVDTIMKILNSKGIKFDSECDIGEYRIVD